MESKTMFTRREISVSAALLMLGGATINITGCGGSSSSDPTPTPIPTTDRSATSISSNHGHTAVITGAQLSAGGALLLTIQGAATHSHSIDLTGAEVVSIRNGTTVTKTSSPNGHTHEVTFN